MNLAKYLSSWRDWPLNRDNSEQEMFEISFDTINKEGVLKYMTDNFNDKNEVKNNNKAQNFRTLGNKHYEDLNYDEALKFYNMSISRASRDSIEFGLAVANRSAVLFGMKKYKECLEDINITFNSEYPNNLQYKIYLRQSKCYLKLKLNFEAAKSLRKAQECADKFNELQIAPINDEIQEIKSQLKEELQTAAADNEPNDDIVFTEPTLKDEENPKFINAAEIVDFRYTTTLGRHMVAKNEIKKGEVLFVEEPYAFTTMYWAKTDVRFNICAFCLKRALHCIPCLTCSAFFYCSDKCRQTGWDLSHRWECLGLRRKIIPNADHQLCLSLLFQSSRDGFQTSVEDDTVYGNKENNYPFLNKLLTHKKDVSHITLRRFISDSVWLVLYLKTFTDYFDWLYVQPNRPEGSLEELYKFVGGQLVKYMLQCRCNTVEIREEVVRFKPITYEITSTTVGHGIFLSTVLLNHSCLPNTVHSFHGTKIIVKAKQDIEKGTEITINYLEKKANEIKTEERQSLLETYSSTCSCLACTGLGFLKSRDPFLCPRCRGKAFQEQEGMFEKCIECHLTFNAIQLYQIDSRIKGLLIAFAFSGDQNLLYVIDVLMKQTYHKDNLKYFTYYSASLEHYEFKGDIEKCVDIKKSLVELCKNVYGEDSKHHVIGFMNLSYYLVRYCKTVRKKNAKNYKELLDETETVIKKSADMMQLIFCTANIKKHVDDITKYLNSDNDVFMQNSITYC